MIVVSDIATAPLETNWQPLGEMKNEVHTKRLNNTSMQREINDAILWYKFDLATLQCRGSVGIILFFRVSERLWNSKNIPTQSRGHYFKHHPTKPILYI